jgi:hypothetical protein
MSGLHLQKLCVNNLCSIYFTDDPTNFLPTGAPSFLDFAISKGVLGISKPIAMTSDHLPVSFEVPINILLPKEIKTRNYAKADWKKFRQIITNEIETHQNSPLASLLSPIDIDENIKCFNSFLVKASDAAIPSKNPYIFRYPDSQKIQDLKSHRNFLRKHSGCYPLLKTEVNNLNREIKRETSMLNDKLASFQIDDCSLFQFAKTTKKKFKPIPPL